jgi:hypothetical protein
MDWTPDVEKPENAWKGGWIPAYRVTSAVSTVVPDVEERVDQVAESEFGNWWESEHIM